MKAFLLLPIAAVPSALFIAGCDCFASPDLEGSIFKWANEDRPLVRDGGATRSASPRNSIVGRMLRVDLRAYH